MGKIMDMDEAMGNVLADIKQNHNPDPRPPAKPLTDKDGNVIVAESDIASLQWRIAELEESNRRLCSQNCVLDRENDALTKQIRRYEIRAEIQRLRDEIAELEDEEEGLNAQHDKDTL